MNNETIHPTTEAGASKATGPTTPEGKAISSQNAVKDGLYTREAYIRPGEEAEYEKLVDRFLTDLLPQDTLEIVLVSEIATATWRLRRCNLVEGHMVDQSLFDPMEDPALEKKQRAVDRARAQSHIIIRRSMAELRKLQTERATRRELEINHAESALVDTQQVSRNIEAKVVRDEKWRKRMQKAEKEELERICNGPLPAKRPVVSPAEPGEPAEKNFDVAA